MAAAGVEPARVCGGVGLSAAGGRGRGSGEEKAKERFGSRLLRRGPRCFIDRTWTLQPSFSPFVWRYNWIFFLVIKARICPNRDQPELINLSLIYILPPSLKE